MAASASCLRPSYQSTRAVSAKMNGETKSSTLRSLARRRRASGVPPKCHAETRTWPAIATRGISAWRRDSHGRLDRRPLQGAGEGASRNNGLGIGAMIVSVAVFLLVSASGIGRAAELSVEEVVWQVRAQDDAIDDQTADVEIRTVDADGKERATSQRLYWKNARGMGVGGTHGACFSLPLTSHTRPC